MLFRSALLRSFATSGEIVWAFVANEKNIKQVASIVKNAVTLDRTVVVVSALGGITDLLLQSGNKAAGNDVSYKAVLNEIRQRHIETVKLLLPVAHQSSVLSTILQQCNELEEICNGVFLLNELSPRIKDRIASYGELMSSQIMASYLAALDPIPLPGLIFFADTNSKP